MEHEFIVDTDNERIDLYLQSVCTLSRSSIKKAIAEERVVVNGAVVKKAGMTVTKGMNVLLKEPIIFHPEAEQLPLNIIYEDEVLLVVNKEAGQLVHPSSSEQHHTLVNALLNHCSLSTIAGPLRPGIVHRIDRDTSGLLLVAKNNHVHQLLSEGFKQHCYTRSYIAIVEGRVDKRYFTIDKPIGRVTNHAFKRTIRSDGRPAVTHVEVLACGKKETVVICQLEQGRTHQIRVHLASMHHALVGDWVYGNAKNKYGFKGQALHSWQLVFNHPVTNRRMSFYAPLPTLFQQAVKRIAEE